VTSIIPYNIENKPVETDAELDVPRLQHNLDRVLFNPGVHVMRDPRSRVYNFDPEIAKIMPASEFDYNALGEYITSSKDEKLRQLCVKYKKKYCGSTSSLSAILSHFHYLISAWRKPNFGHLSRSTEPDSFNFTQMLRSPAAAFASFRNGSYAIDADKEYDEENLLASLGKSMEKHFLLPKEEFEKYRRTRSHEISEEQRNVGETYHYSELGDFLVRSQLDAYDPRLPGSGVFDIKTRAVVSIRMDVQGYEKGLGYEISQLRGQWHSFEREYMDMIRAAFLKYSLQVRMGRMDGIFCAYHNTQRIFGYQYIPISEMDVAIHGTDNTRLGDEEFKASISMLNALMDKGTQRWPGRTLRLHVETRDTVIPLMYFFIEPVTDSTMAKVQDANKSSLAATAAKVVEKIKGLQAKMGESAQEDSVTEQVPLDEKNESIDETTDSGPAIDAVWDELMLKVEDVSPENGTAMGTKAETVQEVKPKSTGKRELLGMVVTVKNKVDGSYTDRPNGDYKHWTVQYSIQELEDEKAWVVYRQMKKRRSGVLSVDRAQRDSNWHSMWQGDLKKATKEGKEMRERLEKEDQ
ncbi:Pet127-domain-containing protein, partial [Sarocladium strictum]